MKLQTDEIFMIHFLYLILLWVILSEYRVWSFVKQCVVITLNSKLRTLNSWLLLCCTRHFVVKLILLLTQFCNRCEFNLAELNFGAL